MLDLQGSFNKQLLGHGHCVSVTNMYYLVLSKEFLHFKKVSKYLNINSVTLFGGDGIFPPKIGHAHLFFPVICGS